MDRTEFIAGVSNALGRSGAIAPGETPGRFADLGDAMAEVEAIQEDVEARSSELLEEAATAMETADWNVHRAETIENVGDIIASICRKSGISSVLRSGHEILDEARVDRALHDAGVTVRDMSIEPGSSESEREQARQTHRRAVFSVDMGITGGDYVIAETGTLVVHPKQGVSRLTSLAPPIHVAVIRRGQVLPSLDELFLLEHVALRTGVRSGSMNLISGPSRTGDIEATIVKGIHGPIEVHVVLVG